MFYEHGGNVYVVGEDGTANAVDITAKDKVIEHRELESVTHEVLEGAVVLPPEALPVTLDEIVARFNVSEENPVMFDRELIGAAPKQPEPPTDPTGEEETTETEEAEEPVADADPTETEGEVETEPEITKRKKSSK